MKISNYVLLFERQGNHFVYNTQTLSLLKIDVELYKIIKEAKQTNCFDQISPDIITFLKSKEIIDTINNNHAKDFIKKMEYNKRLKSFKGKTLSLAIAPTLACNFACPYCYEKNLPLTHMKKEVEDGIINFINSFKDQCDSLEICWEGGEPLLAFQQIQSLQNKINLHSLLPLTHQSIITNGYLLTENICEYFATTKLNFAQITIDGNATTHNKSRILKSGLPTYNKIMENIEMLSNILPSCLIVVRTNIHKENKNEFGILYKELKAKWIDRNIKLYPAFVQPNENCKVTCCTPKDKSEFYLNLKRNHDIKNINFVPKHKLGSCSATNENSYLIDPEGYLYKCWNDIGLTERRVGSVFEGITNNTLIAKYIIGSDKYTDSNCLSCSLFPICDGGCNRHRMDNIEQNTCYNLCPFDENGIEEYLYEYYKSK